MDAVARDNKRWRKKRSSITTVHSGSSTHDIIIAISHHAPNQHPAFLTSEDIWRTSLLEFCFFEPYFRPLSTLFYQSIWGLRATWVFSNK